MRLPVIVTGGAGYIGSHTCKALAQNGFYPITIDNLVYGHKWAVKWGPLFQANILNEMLLDNIFLKYKPIAVFHFAAFAYVGESVENPGKYYKNNVAGTIELLERMRVHGCSKIIFSSSCATYGDPKINPISEREQQNPINPYGRSKLMVEKILSDYDNSYGIRFAALRYFNAAGADSEGEIGESHNPETHLIPLAIYTAIGRRQFLPLYGTDYPTIDGTAIRDFIHVSDLANAHVLALKFLLTGNRSLFLNLGLGRGYSVKEVINTVELVSNNKINTHVASRREGDPAVLVAEPSETLKELGWKPKYNDLESIVETAYKWHFSRI